MPRAWGSRIDETLLAWRQIGEFEFYIRKRSVVMVKRTRQLGQCIVFHSWYTTRPQKLTAFSNEVLVHNAITLEEIISLAKKHDIPYMGASPTTVKGLRPQQKQKSIVEQQIQISLL